MMMTIFQKPPRTHHGANEIKIEMIMTMDIEKAVLETTAVRKNHLDTISTMRGLLRPIVRTDMKNLTGTVENLVNHPPVSLKEATEELWLDTVLVRSMIDFHFTLPVVMSID